MIRMLSIHHWDTDGIASASLLGDVEPGDHGNLSPPVGEFRFDSRIERALEDPGDVFILDLNIPDVAEGLDRRATFLDHHLQKRIENPLIKQINPILSGRDPSDYPSATVVLSDHIGIWNLKTVLGAVGDVGIRAFDHPKIAEITDRNDLSREEVMRLVQLIDSNYITMDRNAVEDAVRVLNDVEIGELLVYDPWVSKTESVDRVIDDSLSGLIVEKGFAFIEFDSGYNIISKVARKAVWEMGNPGAVVVNRGFNGKSQVYFRVNTELSKRLKMMPLIEALRKMGVNAGGKEEVMGSIFPSRKTDEVIGMINNTIDEYRRKGE
jgi:hypothetical protein